MSPSGNKAAGVLPVSTPETSQGPFSEYLLSAKRPEPQQQSGWGGTPALVMGIADSFLRGAQQGRVASFLHGENEKQKKITEFDGLAQSYYTDPDLTPEGKQLIKNVWMTAKGQHIMEAADSAGGGQGKGGKSGKGGNPLVQIFREIGLGMTGGKMPEGAKAVVDPDKAIAEIARIAKNPQYSVRGGVEGLHGSAEAAVGKASPKYFDEALKAAEDHIQRMNSLDPANRPGDAYEARLRARFHVRPKPGSQEESVVKYRESFEAPQTVPPPGPSSSQPDAGPPPLPGMILPPSPGPDSGPPSPQAFQVTPLQVALAQDAGALSEAGNVEFTNPATGKKEIVMARQINVPNRGPIWIGPDNRQISATDLRKSTAANEPMEKVVGPDGKPKLVPRSQAEGMQPYVAPRAAEAMEEVVGADGKRKLVPRSQSTGLPRYHRPTPSRQASPQIAINEHKLRVANALSKVLEQNQDKTIGEILGEKGTGHKSWRTFYANDPDLKGVMGEVQKELEGLAKTDRTARPKENQNWQAQAKADAGRAQQNIDTHSALDAQLDQLEKGMGMQLDELEGKMGIGGDAAPMSVPEPDEQ